MTEREAKIKELKDAMDQIKKQCENAHLRVEPWEAKAHPTLAKEHWRLAQTLSDLIHSKDLSAEQRASISKRMSKRHKTAA